MDNKNTPDEIKEQLPETTGHGRKFPLVLPEGELPQRSRPAVTEEKLAECEENKRARPSVNSEEILAPTERKVYEGRITGQRHSTDTTAAPLRIRPDEGKGTAEIQPKKSEPQNDPVEKKPLKSIAPKTEKIKKEKKSAAKEGQKKTEPAQKKKSALLPAAWKKGKVPVRGILLLVLFLLVISAAGFGMYRIGSVSRPVNPVETDAAETDAAETKAAETQNDETDVVETASAETEWNETAPAETAPVDAEPQIYTVRVEGYGREPVTETTESVTVAQFLEAVGITLTENDRPAIPVDTVIEGDMTVVIDHVEYRVEEVNEPMPFTAETREVQTIPRGETKMVQAGEDGVVTVSYRVEIVNGTEVGRTTAEANVTKEPVPEITEIGVGGELVGADGKTYTYSYMRVVSASAYRLEGPTWLGHDASEKTVAANLGNLPLGTKLYVKSGAYDFGPRTVEDTGTVEGYDILLWIPADSPLMEAFAANPTLNDVVIYYLD